MSKPYSEIRLSLSSSVQNLPYSVQLEEDVHPYVSIVSDPDTIDEIPELQNEPELRQFVLDMNSPGLTFETFRIAHWYGEYSGQKTRCLCLGFHFRDKGLFSNLHAYAQVADHILQTRLAAKAAGSPPLLEAQRAFLKTSGIHGMVMDIFLEGIGSDNNGATKNLVEQLDCLRPVLCCPVSA